MSARIPKLSVACASLDIIVNPERSGLVVDHLQEEHDVNIESHINHKDEGFFTLAFEDR